MVEKPYLAKSNGIEFRNFGHKQGIQVRRRNPWLSLLMMIDYKSGGVQKGQSIDYVILEWFLSGKAPILMLAFNPKS